VEAVIDAFNRASPVWPEIRGRQDA
jgi:hypothetical protein